MSRRTVQLALMALLGACSSPTEPVLRDVPVARARWLSTAPIDYTFEYSVNAFAPTTGFTRVTVVDRKVSVIAPLFPAPEGIAAGFTLDELWDRILAARDKGEINEVAFDTRGVPLIADMGPWPVDGGVRYTVRRFQKNR